MCGIAGWIDWEKDLSGEQPVLEKMAQAIRHRGPDADGFWLSQRAALAHRRLIVIDPEGGLQPMVYRQGDRIYTLTYNGEIYNYLELRRLLQERGHVFKTNSDTEVLLHTYLEWGEDCVRHLNGIFAFAIWDEAEQKLFLGRDHLGVKPLFYAERGSAVLFASEIKALLAHPAVKPELDQDGLAEIFGMGPMRTPGVGVYKDVKEVRAGHTVVFTREGKRITRYWELKSKPHTDDVETTAERIREILEDTVRRQLISDMPLVAMLSGGLDSSGLTAIAGKELSQEGKTLHTYSLDFVGSDRDFQEDLLHRDLDQPWVKRVSEHVKTEHHTIVLDADELLENILVPLRARDLPGIGEMETSLYLLFREMKKDATVALSGESADEVFSGYPWFHQEEFLNARTFPWLVSTGFISKVMSPEALAKVRPDEYVAARYEEAIAEVPVLPGETELEARQREMSYLFITRFLPFMLDRKDRTSGYVGFEVRVPFCDYRLVEYLFNVPYQMKTVDNIEKGILRRALKGYLPDDVLYRRKSAYPTAQNPKYFQAVKRWMKEILNDANSPVLPLIDKKKVEAVIDGKTELNDGRITKLLEYLIQVNMWLKEYGIVIR
ncbi:asparagine synthase (glutamine-hydrolyzing) [Polycladomyces subterraneus]|uniref:asparagine synthase (glutamine-hydrolyzing) n=1 Tax=Polycladomyces subterraneus TaxID=1016997 RepID=A0ABT8ILP2_9BACL|nr:asparagine synthase (glutamine-hydrolyzing) [Polycladomyces subterraneus]MDN4593708.1 asparagine synthase (glutamine-hydrolyzing) [Polycladomyces subterraneus]